MLRTLKPGALFGFSQIASAIFSLARNIMLARTLTVEEFGIASTFAIALSLIEMSTGLSLDKYILQAKFGFNHRVLAVNHFLVFFRGIFLSLVLFFSADLIAHFFGLEHIVWAYQLIAISPALRGLLHMEAIQQQKRMNLLHVSLVDLIPETLATALLIPVLFIWPDYRAVIFVTLFVSFAVSLTSHLLAKQPYRFSVNIPLTKDIWQFAWPMTINSLLMFFVFQGDRLLVGSFYSMEKLGYFSAVFGLFSMPVLLISRLASSIGIPMIAHNLNKNRSADTEIAIICLVMFFFSAFAMSGFIFLGKLVVTLAYGEKYLSDLMLIYWLAISMGIRVFRIPVLVISLASGNSKNGMYCNIVRSVGLLLGLIFAVLGLAFEYILIAIVLGETLAAFFGYYLVRNALTTAVSYIRIQLLSFSFFIMLFIDYYFYRTIEHTALSATLFVINIACFSLIIGFLFKDILFKPDFIKTLKTII